MGNAGIMTTVQGAAAAIVGQTPVECGPLPSLPPGMSFFGLSRGEQSAFLATVTSWVACERGQAEATPSPEKEGATCYQEVDRRAGELQGCSGISKNYFDSRFNYEACISNLCGELPADPALPAMTVWSDCVVANTITPARFINMWDFSEGTRQDVMCQRESFVSPDLPMTDDEFMWVYFDERISYQSCLERLCGLRPEGQDTEEWDVCAASHTEERPSWRSRMTSDPAE